MSTEHPLGYAILPVAESALVEMRATSGMPLFDLCDMQGRLRAAGVFDQVHAHLALPDSFAIVSMYWFWQQNAWHVVVSSKDLPQNEAGMQLPTLQATYLPRNDGGKTLVHIEVYVIPSFSQTYQMCSRCFETRDLCSEPITDTLGQRVFFCRRCWDAYLKQEQVLIVT